MKIKVDFSKVVGDMRPMHAIDQPPMFQLNGRLMHYLSEAGMPYSRLHDVQGVMGSNLYVDIPNIFRDFDADENLPSSYSFAFTDELIRQIIEQNVQPIFRLGVTIENYPQFGAFRIYPPKDFAKWARICEHIVRHYNEGWADGFNYGIRYWEIWCEPDDANFENAISYLWKGTPEQFFEMYTITAKHLKACFGDSIAVGGYGSCGFHRAFEVDPNVEGIPYTPKEYASGRCQFAHRFFQYISKEKAPIDFFSWHSYDTVEGTVRQAEYCRRLLAKYGYEDVPDILDEWNVNPFMPKERNSEKTAADAFAMMLTMQNRTKTAMLNYYDGRCGASVYSGLFNPDTWEPYLTYFVFKLFNDAFVLKKQVFAESENGSVIVCAAANEKRKVVLLVNQTSEPSALTLDFVGANADDAEIIMTNCEYKNTLTGKTVVDCTMTLPPYTCAELRI